MKLKQGKLPSTFLDQLLKKYTTFFNSANDLNVIIGPKIGQDSAVVDIGDKYLVLKTDPITFATDEIGYYAVNVNANDIATAGAKPKWFMAVILLPEKDTDEAMVEKIFSDIYTACQALHIAIIGGHTEISHGLERPIVIGSMIGEVEKAKLITSMGAKPKDAIIITKGIVIEGAAIIANEKEGKLREHGFTVKEVASARKLLHTPGISVVKEALLAVEHFKVHAMHDPTEGGLAMGLVELAENSKCGLKIEYNKIPFIPGSKAIVESFNLNPLSTITSGTLIIAVSNTDTKALIELLQSNGIEAARIGEFTDKPNEYLLKMPNGKEIPLKYSETDEITKIFQ